MRSSAGEQQHASSGRSLRRPTVIAWSAMVLLSSGNAVALWVQRTDAFPGATVRFPTTAPLTWLLLGVAAYLLVQQTGVWGFTPAGLWWAIHLTTATMDASTASVGAIYGAAVPGLHSGAGGLSTHLLSQALAWGVILLPAAVDVMVRRAGDLAPSLPALTLSVGAALVWWWWTQRSGAAPALLSAVPLEPVVHVAAVAAVAARAGIASTRAWRGVAAAAVASVGWAAGGMAAGPLAAVLSPRFAVLAVPALIGLVLGAAFTGLGHARTTRPEGLQHREGVALLLALNVLNVLDALLTWWVIDRGVGMELNPVVDVITLPGKVALVAIGSYLVFRWRPRALVVPVIALGIVLVHHVLGWAFAVT